MGGIGSGSYLRWTTRPLTTDLRSLDIRKWERARVLREGNNFNWLWHIDGEETACINVSVHSDAVRLSYRARDFGEDWEPMAYNVPIRLQEIPNGGHRNWFLCPAKGCGRRVAVLYGGRVFACRSCYGLAYPSQSESELERLTSRSQKLRERLGWNCSDTSTYGPRPKGMHRKTFDRIVSELAQVDDRLCESHRQFLVDLRRRLS